MARSVGIELTETAVRILWLESGRKPRILAFCEEPVAAGEGPWEARAAEAVRGAFVRSKIPRGPAAASLDSGEAILREIALPFRNEDQIRKTLRFEMESQIHNYTIEQLVVDHYRTGETEKGTLLLGAAVPKEAVGRRLKVLAAAGVDPVALDLDAAAVFNAMLHAGAIATDDPLLVVYGTEKFTKLILVERRRPRSIRTIRFALPEGAEEGVRRGLMGILAREIARFLLAGAAPAAPGRILLAGAFEDAATAAMLEEASGIPVGTFDLLGAVEHALPEGGRGVGPRLGVPLGLALKGLGVDALGLDFRQEEFSYRRRAEAVRTAGMVGLELAALFLAAVGLHFYFRAGEARRAAETVLAAHKALVEEATGEKVGDPLEAFPRLQEALRRYEGPLAKGAPLERSAREAWIQLYRALEEFQRRNANATLGEGTLYLEMEGLDIRQATTPGNESFEMILRGKIRNVEFAGKLREAVREVELFRDAEFNGPFTPVGEGLVQFSLRAYKGRRAG